MAFKDYLTAEGERLLNKSISESLPVTFTRLVMGSGYLAQGTNEKNVTDIVIPIKELPIETVALNDSTTTVITVSYTNDDLEEGFFFREKAIYMKVGEEEVIGIYGNAGNTAEYIDTAKVCVVEKLIRTVLQLSNDEVSNITLNSGNTVTKEDLEAYKELQEQVQEQTQQSIVTLEKTQASMNEHTTNKSNPHGVTKTQIGLGNVDNTADKDKSVKYAETAGSATKDGSGNNITTTYAKVSSLSNHTGNTDNPHGVTKVQVGLGNVDNTADANKSVKYAATAGSATKDGSGNIIADTYAKTSHGTHVSYGTSAKALGTSSAGTASTVSRSDHVHALPSLMDCSGTLTVAKGGTGATTAKEAEYNVLGGMTAATTEMTDTSQIAFAYSSPSKTQGRLYWRSAIALWDYIKSKLDAVYSTIRYVNDESDENYGWIQYKEADGTWVNWEQAYTQRFELYVDGNNGANFASYETSTETNSQYKYYKPTITPEAEILKMVLTGQGGNTYVKGCVISEKIDLTSFETLKFYHESKGTGSGGSGETKAFFFISTSIEKGFTPVVKQELFNHYNNNNKSGDVTIDISSLSGEYYIGFDLHAYGSANANVSVKDMYME